MKFVCLLIMVLFLPKANNEHKDNNINSNSIEIKSDLLIGKNFTSVDRNIGKYPSQVQLLSKEPINTRLKSMLGKNYNSFIKNWNVETPIEKKESIFHTSGCKAHDCSMNSYDLFMDSKNNILNVYHIKDGKKRLYKENNRQIVLPEDYAKLVEYKRENASLEVVHFQVN